MLQTQQEQRLKKVLTKILDKNYSFIKIHGGKYQMAGLPDFLILTPGRIFWLEHKRNFTDRPKKIQQYMIKKLRKYGIFTGYIVNDFVYKKWSHWAEGIDFETLIVGNNNV